MQIKVDEKRWFNRQSFLTRMMLLAVTFFIVFSVVDYLFDGAGFTQKQLIGNLIRALAFGSVVAFWTRGKRNSQVENETGIKDEPKDSVNI